MKIALNLSTCIPVKGMETEIETYIVEIPDELIPDIIKSYVKKAFQYSSLSISIIREIEKTESKAKV